MTPMTEAEIREIVAKRFQQEHADWEQDLDFWRQYTRRTFIGQSAVASESARELGRQIVAVVRRMSWRRRIVTFVVVLAAAEAVSVVLVRIGWAT